MIQNDLRTHLERELAELEATERPRLLALIGSVHGGDAADQADRAVPELHLAQVDRRIERLRDRLATLDRAPAKTGRPGPLPGATVILDFGAGPETYLLSDFPHGGTQVITRHSPLGRALAGARPGETIRYHTPLGAATVTLVEFTEELAAG
jgi:transcription elongation GreA/GreB family factor